LELQKWHSILTGSCLAGRLKFLKERQITSNSLYTIDEFIAYTKDGYGAEVI
jgi:hypothetical protein